jgi:hypothetical protein
VKEETAIRILKDLYDYGDLPQACLQALEKATTSLKYQRTAKIAIERSAATVTELQEKISRHEAALDEAVRQFTNLKDHLCPEESSDAEEFAAELKKNWKEAAGL